MTSTTDYFSPFSLWVCVRRQAEGARAPAGEPARAASGALGAGPLVFVSRLHAQLYAGLRNREGGAHLWQCVPLQAFGLRDYMRTLGGRVDCELAYGFMADEAGALVIADGAPAVRFLELTFEAGDDIDDPTFSFNQWAFEFIHAEWLRIGAWSFHVSFGPIDEMGDAALARLGDAVLVHTPLTRVLPDVDHWAVYDPRVGRWIAAAASVPVHALTLH